MNARTWIFLIFSLLFVNLNAAIINVPADQTTIQLAVNAASAGDEIVVANGTYTESVNLDLMDGSATGNIIIRAANALGATVDGGVGAAFYATGSFTGDITIQDFNLDRNAGISNTLGVIDLLNVNGNLTIIGNDFDTNFGGSAMYIDYSVVRTANIRILDNTTSTTIAGDNGDFLFVQTTVATVLDIVIDGNTVLGLEDNCFEFDLEGTNSQTQIRITDNSYSAPVATSYFFHAFVGASSSNNAQANVSISGNMITNPDADGIFIETNGTGSTLDILIASNTFTGTAGINDDAIHLGAQSNTSNAVVRAIIDNNGISNPAENGIYINPETDPGNITSNWNVVVSNNNISGTVGGDAGVYFNLTDSSDPNYIMNIDITGNTSVSGTANAYLIDCGAATPTINFEGGAGDCATQIGNTNTGGSIACSCGAMAANAVNDDNIPANAGNFIWNDVNADGDQDGGESGVAGVALSITGTQAIGGAVNRTTVSDSDGEYTFGALLPGTYTITATLPPQFSFFSGQDLGGNDNMDSDFDISSGQAAITLTGGAGSDISIDAGMSNTPFPIEMSWIDATPLEKVIRIDWKTAVETSNTGFEIERKQSGEAFQKIGWVDSKGNTTSGFEYEFLDTETRVGTPYFYRLKQIDVNGTFTYSHTVVATIGGDPVIELFPNPIGKTLHIRKAVAGSKIEFLDMTGRIIYSTNIKSEDENLDVSGLGSGFYLVRVVSPKGESFQMMMEK